MGKLFLSVILSLSYSYVALGLAGQERIDSLEAELPNAKRDSNQVILLNSLSFHYSNRNTVRGIEYAQKALQLSIDIKWRKGEASAYNSLGINYEIKSDYPKALKYYLKALNVIEGHGSERSVAVLLNNIGLIHLKQYEYSKALEYFNKSLESGRAADYKRSILLALHNIGTVYTEKSEYSKALEYFNKSLVISEEIDDMQYKSSTMSSIGVIYSKTSDYSNAIKYFREGLQICQKLKNKSGIANFLFNIGELYKKLVQDSVNVNPSELDEFKSFNRNINLNKAVKNYEDAILIFEEIGDLDGRSQGYKALAQLYKLKGEYVKSTNALELHILFKDSVFTLEKEKELATLDANREKEVAEKELQIQKMENIRTRNESYLLYFGIVGLLIVVIVFFYQRKASEKLLLNILPKKIAKRLKGKEKYIADRFEEASVVFIDQVEFTKKSSEASPEELVRNLNDIYTQFDKIADKYGLEKIKTIGDCYMAAAGIPEHRTDHAEATAKFAMEAISVQLNIKKKILDSGAENSINEQEESGVLFRCGIDSGPVVAGVIGRKKFIYDLWGDTVNTASRMEEYCEPGKIQVTERFKSSAERQKSADFQFEERGEIDIKGKGLMKTYYLMRKKNY